MKKISIDEHAFQVPFPSGIGAKNTISSGPDDGANNLLASHFWQPMRHATTQQGVGNGLTLMLEAGTASTGELNICGHGNEGLLETGMGQTGPFDNNRIILTWNEYIWGPELDRIKPSPTTQISIWSCHTGAGQDGADLLFAMAKRCGRAVRAGTGFLYSNSAKTWWENGSVWQVATPVNKPNPIAAPSPHSIVTQALKFDVGGQEFEATDIDSIEVTLINLGRGLMPPKSLRGQSAQSAVVSMFLPPALEMTAHISGIKTAKIKLDFGKSRVAEYDVYNDRLAVDSSSQTAYYLAPALQRFYNMLP
ncbi:hypothetical protein [Variovorax sp. GB1P17]|uniref:hypothetical protein n=1 Tax=Variovorax sp. GB1P17 TaxID=3443740 RepID=UPI003F48A8A7